MRTQHESKLQQSCVKWFKYSFPNVIIASFPNEGKRSPSTAARMKAEGMKSGMPDLFIARPSKGYSGLFIEMKYGKGRVTEMQTDCMRKLDNEGYMTFVCYSFDEFKSIVETYFGL
jgi:hypothetical protein